MKRELVEAVAQGRVWSGAGARRVGLVDELGGLEMALRVAKRKAGLPPDARVDVVSWPRQRGLLERLFGGEASGGILWPSLGPADANMQGTVRLVASYASLAQVFRAERVAVILARPVEVK